RLPFLSCPERGHAAAPRPEWNYSGGTGAREPRCQADVMRGANMTKVYVQIEFALRCSAERYRAIAEEVAPRMAQVAGLEAKWWWLDPETGRAGGVYKFESRQAAEQYVVGPIVSALREASFCEAVQARVVEL